MTLDARGICDLHEIQTRLLTSVDVSTAKDFDDAVTHALSGDTVVFVEVKTRKAGSMTTAESSINEQKQRALRRAASAYIAQHRSRLEPRFSLITVEMVGTNVVDLAFVEDMM